MHLQRQLMPWLRQVAVQRCFSQKRLNHDTSKILSRSSNQALALGKFALDFMDQPLSNIDDSVLHRTKLFLVDSLVCGVTAIRSDFKGLQVLREEALTYPVPASSTRAAHIFGDGAAVSIEKAILANSGAVRELDANGTVFGFNPDDPSRQAGEFGHNDFYPVVLASCEALQLNGADAIKAMVLLDEIRGRLCEAFSLKEHSLDHVLYGAIASGVVYGL